MAKSSEKSKASAKMSAAVKATLDAAMKKLEQHYGAVLAEWPNATQEQKRQFLEHSPVLAGLLDWCDQWRR